MDRFLGHRAKITPPVLINRGTDFELDDDTTVSRSEVTDEQGMTPRTAGQEGEDDPHLTVVCSEEKAQVICPRPGRDAEGSFRTLETK